MGLQDVRAGTDLERSFGPGVPKGRRSTVRGMGPSREVPGAESELVPPVDAQDAATGVRGEPPEAEEQGPPEAERVKRPGELWRIEGSLSAVRAELDQLGSLDDPALRARVAQLEHRWYEELGAVLPEAVLGELHRFLDWADDAQPGASELRIGLAQLSGWLDGLIAGLGVSIGEPSD